MRISTVLSLSMLVAVSDPASAAAPWFDTDWTRRVPITADASLIEGTETFSDFALLVQLDGSRNAEVFTGANPDGSDLLFTAGDGTTELARQIVSYDPVAQTAEIWVRVSSFSETQNELYLYYSHPDTSLAPDPADAWGSEYRLVYHFEGDPGTQVLEDSSPQGSDAFMNPLSVWTSSDVEAGQIGQAWHFNGDTHHVNSTRISTQDESYTISAWLRSTERGSDFIIEANPGFWHVSLQAPPFWNSDYTVSGTQVVWNPQPVPSNDGYHHFLWAFEAENDTVKFHLDGIAQSVRVLYNPAGGPVYPGRLINPDQNQPVGILGGMFYGVEDIFAGGADEFRIREGVMSPARVLTEYRSQQDNFSFLTFGPEEDAEGTTVGIGDTGNEGGGGVSTSVLRFRAHPNPFSIQSILSGSLPQPGFVNLSVYDLAGRRVTTLVDREVAAGTWTSQWDGRDSAGRPLAAGLYFLRLETPLGVRTTKISIVR